MLDASGKEWSVVGTRIAFVSTGMGTAIADYAPSAHFYPALWRTLLQGSTHVGLE